MSKTNITIASTLKQIKARVHHNPVGNSWRYSSWSYICNAAGVAYNPTARKQTRFLAGSLERGDYIPGSLKAIRWLHKEFGMALGGGWFNSDLNPKTEPTIASQRRRHAFLKMAIEIAEAKGL